MAAHWLTEPQGKREAEHLDELGHQPDKIHRLGSGLEKGNAGNPAGAPEGDQAGEQQRGNPRDTPVVRAKRKRHHHGQEYDRSDDERNPELRSFTQMLGNEPSVSPGTRGARGDHCADGDPVPRLGLGPTGLDALSHALLVRSPHTVLRVGAGSG